MVIKYTVIDIRNGYLSNGYKKWSEKTVVTNGEDMVRCNGFQRWLYMVLAASS